MNATSTAVRTSSSTRRTSAHDSVPRIRKNITALSAGERKLLKHAFQEIRDRPHNHPLSYFAIASKHYLPHDPGGRVKCRHKISVFLPWHRSILYEMESALRSVPGCESVTLPYWNLENRLPQILDDRPFHPYELPVDIDRSRGSPYRKGYVTERYRRDEIHRRMRSTGIRQHIEFALEQKWFEDFWHIIEDAHDNAHEAVGPTMGVSDAATFEPLFWFFHANWDRLWFRWQSKHGAQQLKWFEQKLRNPAQWREDSRAELYPMVRYNNARQTVELPVRYVHPKSTPAPMLAASNNGSVIPVGTFRLTDDDMVSLMLKGVKRLEVSGGLLLTLKAGRSVAASQYVFQPLEPKRCQTCSDVGDINVFIRCKRAKLKGNLSIVAHRVDARGKKHPVSLESIGNPSVNIRSLLETDELIA